jgi:hypothetical protein
MPPTQMFEMLKIGPMTVKGRTVAPPPLLGHIMGSDEEAERHISYWESRIVFGTQQGHALGKKR